MKHSDRRRRALHQAGALTLLALALAGCAVQPNGKGGVLIGVDNAQLFGTTLGTFTLANGDQGTLRRDANNGAYSIKLNSTMRVIPLANAQSARLARIFNMGQRTVVVVETQERNCPFKYEVLSIQGTDVLQWAIGTCNDRPRVDLAEAGNAIYFDFAANGRIRRNIYIDGRMLNAGDLAAPGVNVAIRPFADADLRAPAGAAPVPVQPQPGQPGQPQRAASSSSGYAPEQALAADGARVIPLPPQRAGAATQTPAATTTASANAAGKPRAAAAPTPKASGPAPTPAPMKMPTEEIKTIHLDLRQ